MTSAPAPVTPPRNTTPRVCPPAPRKPIVSEITLRFIRAPAPRFAAAMPRPHRARRQANADASAFQRIEQMTEQMRVAIQISDQVQSAALATIDEDEPVPETID